MSIRKRILTLCAIALGAVAAVAGYRGGSERQAVAPAESLPPLAIVAPQGPPREAALKFLHQVAVSSWWHKPIPVELDAVLADAAWGNTVPPRGSFTDAIRRAGRRCDQPLTTERWIDEVEWFGGLRGYFARRTQPPTLTPEQFDGVRDERALEPFWQASLFGSGPQQGSANDYFLAIEPPACGDRGPRLAITYGGWLQWFDPADQASRAKRERSAIITEYATALRSNDVRTASSLLGYGDRLVLLEALRALVRSENTETIPLLRPLLANPNPEIRYLAALGLAELGDTAVEPVLRSYLGQVESQFGYGSQHYRAILALGKLGFADVRSELEVMADWPGPALFPEEAKRVLEELGDSVG